MASALRVGSMIGDAEFFPDMGESFAVRLAQCQHRSP
jgi:hypothetical protein